LFGLGGGGLFFLEGVGSGHAFLSFYDGEAGEFFEQGDVGDEAVVDDLLCEVHELGLRAERVTQGAALVGPEQVLIKGEAGEPANFRFHARRGAMNARRVRCAKREAREIFLRLGG
jgi:hypothetical protein